MKIPQLLSGIHQAFDNRDFRAERFGQYKLASWQKYFHDDPDFNILIKNYPEALARGDFSVIGSSALTTSDIRQLFLATMLWGYGDRGYGSFRTCDMLATDGAEQKLHSAVDAVRRGEIAEAYRALNLYRCGPSFMSKFLYAVGLKTDAHPLPLILDSVVAQLLQRLMNEAGVDHRQFFRLNKSGTVQYFVEGYERYVRLLNEWAVTLGVLPDAIELFLFENR